MKPRTLTLLATCGLLTGIFTGPAAAQTPGQIDGEIRSPAGTPLPGVTVSVEGSELSSVTDAEGRFALPSVPAGTVTLTLAGSGVEPTREVVRVRPEETVSLRIMLDPQLFVLRGVTATVPRRGGLELDRPTPTGSRLGVAARDLPASLSVISSETMRELGHRTPEEAIESAPGVLAGSGVATIPTFATRGFSGNDIALLRDGVRQNTASQSSRPMDVFNLERIEVLKGPASVLYGEGVIAGAINYVSRTPSSFESREALVSFGSFNTLRVGAGMGGPISFGDRDLRYRIDAIYAGSEGAVEDSGYDRVNLTASVDMNAPETIRHLVFLDYVRDDSESYYGTPLIDGRIDPRTRRTNYNLEDNHSVASSLRARLRSTWTGSDRIELRNEAYLGTHELDWRNVEINRYDPDTELVERSFFLQMLRDDIILGNRLEAHVPISIGERESRLLVGADVHRNDMDRHTLTGAALDDQIPGVDPFAPVRGTGPEVTEVPRSRTVVVETYALFAEHLFHVTDRLRLVTGIRTERFTVDYDNASTGVRSRTSFSPFTWRAGAVYEPREGTNLYGSQTVSAEPVVQLVSLSEAAHDFGLQHGSQWEVGVKQLLFGGGGDLLLSAYRIVKSDIRTSTVIDGERVLQQIGQQSSRGVEAALAVRPGADWFLEGTLAYTDATFDEFNENVGANDVISRAGNRPVNAPVWIAGGTITREFPRGFGTSVGFRRMGERFADTANQIPLGAFTVLNAGVFYRGAGWRLDVRARNITDEIYAEWPAIGGGSQFRLGDPRSFELSVRREF